MRAIINFFKRLFRTSAKKPVPRKVEPAEKPHKPVEQKPVENKTFKFEKGMEGVDISHHVENVNLKQLSDSVDFIYMKATEGTTFVSPTYVSRAKELNTLDIPWGAYHYYRVSSSPEKQAEHFLKYVDANSGIPPVLDIEAINNNFKSHHREDLITFLDIIEKRTGIVPIIYVGYYFARDEIKTNEKFKKYPLWMPWYTSNFSKVKCPEPWDKITIWQYSESGSVNGVRGNVDCNKVV